MPVDLFSKGSKMSNWQGGIRVNAFVSGGLIQTKAPKMVGKKLDGFTHACDWYATFCSQGLEKVWPPWQGLA